MRHLLLALMIALLPIRGWMGDAMALAMLAAPAHSTEQASASTAAPCPDHAMPGEHAGMQDNASADHAHKSCDVCNGPVMALSAPVVPGLVPVHGVLALPAERFASSEPHRGIKPPIS
ncbi:hypothetical protein [Hydrogenophaga laconesensis]|uniref:DUF2946 domain-containing protein n=1 Tax=Hydrogenophaga laconesensis TaxID=1805971 RepID=A0ABU1VB75_9BURK|nr:hypothetical protein [Hydrogenophaga laconesensis]MDR7094692.1 hypothetical protein [Hydrogenophaga laconesensis]